MAFESTNETLGLKQGDLYPREDIDPHGTLEKGFFIPWVSDKESSWLYYNCMVGVMLDSGLVVHNRLPQVDNVADTLSSVDIDDPNFDISVGGVNLKCADQYTDIVQRMGHTRYWFRLWGHAMRAGYQIPIPGMKTIGGVPAIPYDRNPQWSFNAMVPDTNMGGVVLWRAAWSLWYTIAVPPVSSKIPAVDPTSHIRSNELLPIGIQLPYSQPDDNATAGGQQGKANFGVR